MLASSRILIATVVLSTLFAVSCRKMEEFFSRPSMQVCNTFAATTVDRNAQFLLTADVPAGAQDLGPTFQVLYPLPGESWRSCSPGTACNGAGLPSMQPIAYPTEPSATVAMQRWERPILVMVTFKEGQPTSGW